MKAKIAGEAFDVNAYAQRVRSAVSEVVRHQIDCGIDIVTDGEQGTPRTTLEPHVSVVNEYSALGIIWTNSVHHREPAGPTHRR
jgi:hypothetical protein